MIRKMIAATAAALALLLVGCSGGKQPSADMMVEAIVDVFTSAPGFVKTGPRTFTQNFPLNLNKGFWEFSNASSKGCRPVEAKQISCELTAALSLRVTDGNGNRDDYSDAMTQLLCGFGLCPAFDSGEHVFEYTPEGKLRWVRAASQY